MKTANTTLKAYRIAWWIGVPLWVISSVATITIVISYLTNDDWFYKILYCLASILNTHDIHTMGIYSVLLVLLTYIYLLLWFIFATGWWFRNRNSVQISSFDKIRWAGVLLVLIIRPILMALTS